MKKLVNVVEVDDDGLNGLMGERVTFYCINYIWTGKLVGVNEKFVKLEDPAIVYETGPHNTKEWKDAQKLPNSVFIQLSAVEAYGIMK